MKRTQPVVSVLTSTLLAAPLLAAPLLAGIVGCESSGTTSASAPSVSSAGHSAANPADTAAVDTAARDAATKPASDIADAPVESGGDAARAVSASNTFGWSLLEQLGKPDENLAFSPASISAALAMTYAGARGETATQMRSVMAFPKQDDELHEGWSAIIARWRGIDSSEIAIANRLFGAEGTTFEAPFLAVTKSRYGAPLQPLDFAGDPQAQRKLINDWVEEKTKTRITELIPPTGINEATKLVLVNAIYFKAEWQDPFAKEQTKAGSFATPTGEVEAQQMSHVERMPYAEVDGVQIVEKRYKHGEFATVFVLPKKGETSTAALEQTLEDELWAGWIAALSDHDVTLTLPRFKVEQKESRNLTGDLVALGMPAAFGAKADFSGMAEATKFDAVFHKAYVAVDEVGTEAAAATAVVAGPGGAAPAPVKKAVFKADRPFLFFIRDTKTGMVMFVGRVVDPTK